jgi:hypothetical protein
MIVTTPLAAVRFDPLPGAAPEKFSQTRAKDGGEWCLDR